MNTNKATTNAVLASIAVATAIFMASAGIAATPAPSFKTTSAAAKAATAVPAAAKSGVLDNATVTKWERLTNTAPEMVA